MNRMSTSEKVFQVFDVILMMIVILVTIYPIWYVFVASFSDNTQVINSGGVMFWIKDFTVAAYAEVLKFSSVWRGYLNTIIIVVGGTSLNIFMTIIGGYVLSRKSLYMNKYFSLLIVFTMYFSGGMIPQFILVKQLHMYNSIFALIVPIAIDTFNLIIMKSAFASVPDVLEEAAKIDGARQITILFKIMLPACSATLAVLVLYYGVSHWNSWFNAMIYLNDRNKFPLQLILREILMYNNTSVDGVAGAAERREIGETIQYATIMIATIPILCVYPFLQRYFEKGVMVGAVKG